MRFLPLGCVFTLALVACTPTVPGSSLQPNAIPFSANHINSAAKIQHAVIIIQENRSFDNFFAGYPGAVSALKGPGHDGQIHSLKTISFARVDLNHLYSAAITEYDHGKMDGFDLVPGAPPFGGPLLQYSRVERSLIAPYWNMANQYVLADHMFPTEWGPSYTAHINLLASTANVDKTHALVNLALYVNSVVDGSCDDPKGTVTSLLDDKKNVLHGMGPYPCFTFPTLVDSLDARHVSWKYYGSEWPGGGALWNTPASFKSIRYGADWSNNVTFNDTQVLTDAANGTLPAVSWVIPTMPNSDHPGAGSDTGPSWVASVVNAIGNGPDWKSTVIFVVWDDWGGWYDNVAPPQQDFRGLAFRVPCLIISPYAKTHYVSHTPYEFGSIIKTIEQLFSLPAIQAPLATDARANSMFDSFDFSQAPRTFTPFAAKYSEKYFRTQPRSTAPVDDDF